MKQIAEVAVYIPYRACAEGREFFFQKRDGNAPTHPNIFSMFGGQIEAGEDSHTAVLREITEELVYTPAALRLFPQQFTSDANGKLFDVYIEEVGADFEQRVTVLEGEYGRFLTATDIAGRGDVSTVGKEIVAALMQSLA